MTSDTSAPTKFAVGSAGAATLNYASATAAATSETATAGPTVFGDFMEGSFVARARLGGPAQWLHSMSRRPQVRPTSGPQDRTQPAESEIPFGHAFDKRGVSCPKALRARASRAVCGRPLRSAPSINVSEASASNSPSLVCRSGHLQSRFAL